MGLLQVPSEERPSGSGFYSRVRSQQVKSQKVKAILLDDKSSIDPIRNELYDDLSRISQNSQFSFSKLREKDTLYDRAYY